jgi:hypothetical protein
VTRLFPPRLVSGVSWGHYLNCFFETCIKIKFLYCSTPIYTYVRHSTQDNIGPPFYCMYLCLRLKQGRACTIAVQYACYSRDHHALGSTVLCSCMWVLGLSHLGVPCVAFSFNRWRRLGHSHKLTVITSHSTSNSKSSHRFLKKTMSSTISSHGPWGVFQVPYPD